MEKNKLELSELLRLYTEGDSEDQELYAEQRSNLLLYAGDHYNKRFSNYYKRIRDSKELSTEQKLRLTKNHIQFICDTYVNNIVAPNPGVGFSPKNEKEVHDQKVADLHHSVWRDAHQKYNIDDKIDDWADAFVHVGEVATKIFFDPSKGKLKGYEGKVDEDGNPVLDMMGNQIPDESKPVYTGEFLFEDIYGFNMFRPVECKDLRKSEWIGIRSMVNKKHLKQKYPQHEDKINASNDETYQVFDAQKGAYGRADKETLLLEIYYRPCAQYPNGYYVIFTKEVILEEGELPGSVFPIIFQPFRKLATTPRGRSPIKTMRPYQAEINRTASKIAEHQITLGDDKLLIQNGSKLSSGAALPGVRAVNYTGMEPKVLAGRDGSQYLAYMQSQIAEMYQVMGVKETIEEKPSQIDPFTLLYQSARNKKMFQRSIKRFEKFLIEVVSAYLKLAKHHLTDDYLVYAIGTNEIVNIPEFRKLSDINFEIKIEAQSEDVETKLGKALTINHALQYIGSQLKPEDIGKILRQMPFVDQDEMFSDLTLDYDVTQDDILALDRGEMPPVNEYDNHVYSIKRLTARMRQSSFKYLPDHVKQNYANKISVHEQFEANKQLALQRAQQGIIPTGGYMVKADLYVSDPMNPNKTQRVSLPSESVQWLMNQIKAQRSNLEPVMSLNEGAQAQIAEKFSNGLLEQQQVAGGDGAPLAM